MQTIQTSSFSVTGLSVRTTNAREMSGQDGLIGPMWQTFFQTIAPVLREGSQVYGVYLDYESDHSGLFSVMACTDQTDLPATSEQYVSKNIDSGRYLVFPAQGQMPQAVIDAWGEVWSYFESDQCPHQRAYTVDYEHYVDSDSANIYIAIE